MKKTIILIGIIVLGIGMSLWFFPRNISESTPVVSVLFVGDMMFDRTIRLMGEKEGSDYSFSCVTDYLKGFDMVVGNLEGPITNSLSLSLTTLPGQVGNTTFTFPTSTAELLKRNGIGLVSLANNHIFDFGISGVESTRKYLQSAGVGYFGDPIEPSKKYVVENIKGLKVAFIGFNEFLGIDSVASTTDEIKSLRYKVDYIFVFAHWGDEYVGVTEGQKIAGHTFIDAGADAVVGAHSHVIQEDEIYKGKSIYYSLGNFIFDQYWNESVIRGMVLEANISNGAIYFLPKYVSRTRSRGPCLSD